MTKTVLITGAGGFVAQHVARALKHEPIRLIGVSRKPDRTGLFDLVYGASLGESLKAAFAAEKIDVVLHCANDIGKRAFETNVRGTLLWLEEAQGQGVDLQIFLSSLSAQASGSSDYGRAKYALEQEFLVRDGVVFRLGLVIGNGGMCERMKKSMRRMPFVPLIDGGRARVHVLGIDFLCQVITDCILTNGAGLRGRVWQLQQPQPYTLREVMEALGRHFGYRCWFLPIPWAAALGAVLLLERLPFLRLPISSTHLQGLRQSAKEEFRSDYGRFGCPARSLDDLIRQAAQEEAGRGKGHACRG